MKARLFLAAACALGALAAACASPQDSGLSGTGGATTGDPADGGATTATGAGGEAPFDAGTGGGEPLPSILYAHTDSTLYKADPAVTPLALELVGDFDCLGGTDQNPNMTDLAVSESGELWGVSADFVYRLEVTGSTVHCAAVMPLDNPAGIRFYGLTFAPKGLLDPDAEVLVGGNSAGQLFAIAADGSLTQHGTFGTVPANDGNGHTYANAGKPWELSGDIVFLANGGSPVGFATVRDCPSPPSTTGCNTTDTLIELDIAGLAAATTQSITKSLRGQIVKRPGCNDVNDGYGSVYGITAWQSKVFGFSRSSGDGFAIDIDNTDGTACLIESFPGSTWAGAGITTLAPVVPPPPK